MTVPAEAEIMAAIGLHSHYGWYNGSGSCGHIRRSAARALPGALRDRGLRPDPEAMRAADRVAELGDEGEFTLTRTWQACADTIRAHLEGPQAASDVARHVEAHYLTDVPPAGALVDQGDGTFTRADTPMGMRVLRAHKTAWRPCLVVDDRD